MGARVLWFTHLENNKMIKKIAFAFKRVVDWSLALDCVAKWSASLYLPYPYERNDAVFGIHGARIIHSFSAAYVTRLGVKVCIMQSLAGLSVDR